MSVLNLPIEQISADPNNVRRTRASAADDAAMLASVREMGVLVPILVRDDGGPSQFIIIAGHRRVEAAKEAGLETVPARLMQAGRERTLASMQAAENEVRAPMSRVDLWRAMERMQKDGMSLVKAGAAVGVDERTARQLAQLGRLAPPILEQMASGDMPQQGYLHTIAAAPLDEQLAAWKRHKPKKSGANISWYDLAGALAVVRIPRSRAEFGKALEKKHGIEWEEDLFAPKAASFTTSQVTAFKAAQQEHIETVLLPKLEAAGLKGALLPWGSYEALIPAGASRNYSLSESKWFNPKQDTDVVRGYAIKDDGEIARARYVPASSRKANDTAAAPKAPRGPVTAAGNAMVAAQQNKALALRIGMLEEEGISAERSLKLLLVALTSANVRVGTSTFSESQILAPRRLVRPDGRLQKDVPPGELIALALDVLAKILSTGDGKNWSGSGAPAHWIGQSIGADECLDGLAFTTPEFLSTCSLPTLQAMAMPARLDAVITKASDGRRRLEGKLVVPQLARFSAAGPAEPVEPEEEDSADGDEGDEIDEAA